MKSLFSKPLSDPYSYPIGNKPDPYSYALTSKSSTPSKPITSTTTTPSKPTSSKKGPPANFSIQKLGINKSPPTLIIQYRDSDTQKLYHHRIVINKLKRDSLVSDVLYYIKKKHGEYLKKMNQEQVKGLIDKLKAKLGGTGVVGGVKKVEKISEREKEEQEDEQQVDYDDEQFDDDDQDYLQDSVPDDDSIM